MHTPTLDALIRELREVESLLQADRHQEALDRLNDITRQADALHLKSTMLLVMRSWALGGVGRVEAAFDAMLEAARMDPFSPLVTERLDPAIGALREALARPSSTPEERRRIYARLLRAGEATVESHLVMTRLALEEGRLEEAQKLINAVVLVEPLNAEAWQEHARVAQALGLAEVAAESRSRAEAVTRAPTPYGLTTAPAEC